MGVWKSGSAMAQASGSQIQLQTANAKKSNYLPVAEANEVIDGQLARRRGTGLFYAVGLVLVLAAVSHAAFDAISDAPALQVKKIRIEGLNGSVREEVRGRVQLFLKEDSSLLSLDRDRLRQAIEQNPIVSDVRFEKHFPSTLVISAVRREPAALLSAGGFYLVDREGRVMQKLLPEDLSRYDFPYFTGLPAENLQRGEKLYSATFYRALELCRLLRDRDPDLYDLISEVNLGGGDSSGSLQEHSITAYLRGGAEVRFGDHSPAEILPVLDFFLQLLRQQKSELSELAYVDLRYHDRIFYMDRATFLASAAGVLDEAERLAAEDAVRIQKSATKTKRLDQSPTARTVSRTASPLSTSSVRPRDIATGARN